MVLLKRILPLLTIFSLILSPFQQQVFAQLKRPSPINEAPVFNKFVTSGFDLLDNTAAIKLRVTAVEKDLLEKALTDIKPASMLAELNTCSSLLSNLYPNLVDLISAMLELPGKVKSELASNPFRLIGAMKQVGGLGKALHQSEQNVSALIKTTIPALKSKLKEKTGTDLAELTETKSAPASGQ